ncbi:esterase/lipase family protein [Saccharomonospora saliphila]|uniref:esterase/lipase family protein n=1 Tax=Saccharomonospora saliphila TaxID=369829 RepID=UPI0004902B2F|nr:alpha/beta fold hydrolase [Saccharomonospora saliphila]
MRRSRWVPAALLALLVPLAMPAAATAAVSEREPVIFVHGWNSSSAGWAEMVSDFQADGYADAELLAWDYDTRQSNTVTAEEFATVVDDLLADTGASAVDVVTHSMGGLNTRWYLTFLGGTEKVDDWVSLAGPNHGTATADFCYDTSCREMRRGSDFLTTLNDGDETPGATTYGTWWSSCDEIIIPQESTILDGADNTRTACLSHSSFRTDDTVSAQVRDFVA